MLFLHVLPGKLFPEPEHSAAGIFHELSNPGDCE